MRGPNGTRFRGTRQTLTPIPFVANTTQRTEIPRDLLGRGAVLRVTGNLVIATAAATIHSEAPAGLLRNVSLIGGGTKKTLFSGNGFCHYRMSQFNRRAPGELLAPSGVIGTRAFAITIPLDHETTRMGNPAETLFEGSRFTRNELLIDWGSETSFATAGGGGTIALTNVATDIIVQQVNTGVGEIAFDRILTQDSVNVGASNARFDLVVPQAGVLLGAMFRTTRDAGGGAGPVPVDDIIRSITMFSDTTLKHEETISWATLQRSNIGDFQLPGSVHVPGYAMVDRIENGSFASGLNVAALNETKFRLDIVRTGNTENIDIFYDFAEPLPARRSA